MGIHGDYVFGGRLGRLADIGGLRDNNNVAAGWVDFGRGAKSNAANRLGPDSTSPYRFGSSWRAIKILDFST